MRYKNIDCPNISEDGKCNIDSGHPCVCLSGYCQCAFSHKHVIPEPKCPDCGSPLEVRLFIDSWDVVRNKPMDINYDLYCPKCNLRWLKEEAPEKEKRKFIIHGREFWLSKDEILEEIGCEPEDVDKIWESGIRADHETY